MSSAWLVPAEKTVLRGPKEERAPTESLDPLVLLERRGNWVSQDYQVIPDDKDLRVQVDSRDSQEPTERKVQGVSLENLVQEGKEVRRVPVVLEEPEVQRENLVQRAQQAMMVLQVHLVREDLKDHRDQWASLDPKAPLDHLERTGCLDILASEERRVSKGKLVHLVQEVSLGPRDLLERLVLLVREDTLDLLAHPVSRVFQVLLARRELRGTLDHKDPLVKMGPLAFEASPESEAYLVPRAPLV